MFEENTQIFKNTSKKWLVLSTKPQFEKKVSEGLSKFNIINYLPLHKQLRIWHDRKKWVEIPLFRSYIFVYIEEKFRNNVFEIPGTLKFISNAGKVVSLKEEEIKRIEHLCSYLGKIEIEKRNFKIGEEVEVIIGHFKGMKGELISSKGKHKFSISIDCLGSFASIEIDKEHIQKVM